jgi:hypothetical protein
MSKVLNNDHINPKSQQIFGRNWLLANEKLHAKNYFHVVEQFLQNHAFLCMMALMNDDVVPWNLPMLCMYIVFVIS